MEKTLIQSTEELFRKALETMKRKSADYSGTDNAMKNFRIAAQIANVRMSQGILTRLTDKVTRIGNLINNPAKVKEESIFDTCQDLINYAAILHYALQVEKEENDEKQEFFMINADDFRSMTAEQLIEEFRRQGCKATKE